MNVSYNEKLKEIRAIAKANGLVFRKAGCYLNGMQGYNMYDRKTGAPVIGNLTINSAWECVHNGYVDSRAR